MEPFNNVLPENFTGMFYFTNPSSEDFVGKWGNKAYTYPAMKTTPMVIVDATPLEVQNIRKKFAKELAEREFFKSDKYEQMRSTEGVRMPNGMINPTMNSMKQANLYSEGDLKGYIQKCLDPLPIAQQSVRDLPKDNIMEKLSRDPEGELNTTVVQQKGSLKLKDKNASLA